MVNEMSEQKMREALEHIIEYWNRDQNEAAMADALFHIIETAEKAIPTSSGKGLTDGEIEKYEWLLSIDKEIDLNGEGYYIVDGVKEFARAVITAHEAKRGGDFRRVNCKWCGRLVIKNGDAS
jgi:hypothetical protein